MGGAFQMYCGMVGLPGDYNAVELHVVWIGGGFCIYIQLEVSETTRSSLRSSSAYGN